ncbi:O-antigen ligase family protein [Sulfobacillus acidophilus]|uniref:O-antigen ligase family protein n=1 Tax=Sulfobacillus acidophilus TaxID=53633 RepID=A0ABS3AWK8_9FIRM|nr:O-antigen ligase family protein [Sulfobacillus acidophilus]
MYINKNILLEKLAILLSVVCIIGSVLAFGGVHPTWIIFFTVSSLISLGFHVLNKYLQNKEIKTSYLILPFLLGIIFTLTMLIPMPLKLLSLVQNEKATLLILYASLLSPLKIPLLSYSLSYVPTETSLRFFQLISACAIFTVISDTARKRANLKFISLLVLVSGAVLFLTALFHTFVNAEYIWGIKKAGNTPFFAPLINPNHLARIFGVYAFILLAFFFLHKKKLYKYWFLLTAILCAFSVFLTLSRGGILFFTLFCALLAGLVYFTAKKSTKQQKITYLLISLAIVFIPIALGMYVAGSSIFKEIGTLSLESLSSGKLSLYKSFPQILTDNWGFGIGANSLGNLFYHKTANVVNASEFFTGKYSVYYFENIALQTIIDHGIFKGLILVIMCLSIGYILLKRHTKNFYQITITLAIIFIVASDFLDFSLETNAILFGTSLMLALAAANIYGNYRLRIHIKPKIYLSLYVLFLTSFIAVYLTTHNFYEFDLNREIDKTNKQNKDYLLTVLSHHPYSSYYSYRIALEKRSLEDLNGALKWGRVATFLRPTNAKAHLESARALLAKKQDEKALNSYKQAWIANESLSQKIMNETGEVFTFKALEKYLLPKKTAKYYFTMCSYLPKANLECYKNAMVLAGISVEQIFTATRQALLNNEGEQAQYFLSYAKNKAISNDEYAKLKAKAVLLSLGASEAIKFANNWQNAHGKSCKLLFWLHKTHSDLRQFALAERYISNLSNKCAMNKKKLLQLEIDLYERSEQTAKSLNKSRQLMQIIGNKSSGPLIQKARLELKLNLTNQVQQTIALLDKLVHKQSNSYLELLALKDELSKQKNKSIMERYLKQNIDKNQS